MKVNTSELETLFEIQRDILAQRKLVAEANEIRGGGEIDQVRDRIATLSEAISDQRLKDEELERDLKRLENDVELVENRLKKDNQRLNESSSSKDIAGIQVEIESLKSRLSKLEDDELELMDQVEISKAELTRLQAEHQSAEAKLEVAKSDLQQKLAGLKQDSDRLISEIQSLKTQVAGELLELFEARLAKGIAVGRLTGSNCSACNMSLNSTAMSEISAVAEDELCSCPECGAILVR
ncbi:MAG: C4-type zinc ribbon domain-containing protein [Aquiluna sp.]|jgi:predicted  nucleic acid-binding Zn-ribbon protein